MTITILQQRLTAIHPGKRAFEFNNSRLSTKDIELLVEGLNTRPNITTLILSNNNLSNESVLALANLKYITHLVIPLNCIDDGKDIKGYHIQALAENSVITTLDLSENDLTDYSGKILADHAKQKKIHVGNTGMSEECIAAISACTKANQYSASIGLAANPCGTFSTKSTTVNSLEAETSFKPLAFEE